MIDLFRKYSQRFVSRWLILFMDICVAGFSFLVATFVRFNFDLTYVDDNLFKYHLFLTLAIRGIFFFGTKVHRGIVRHTSMEDANLIFKAVFASSIVLIFLNYFGNEYDNPYISIPLSIIIMDFFTLLVSMMVLRITIKMAYHYLIRSTGTESKKVIIYGAGLLGMIVKNSIQSYKFTKSEILCYIDDNPNMVGKTMEGIRVFSRKDAINTFLSDDKTKKEIDVIFAIGAINTADKNDIVDDFLELGVSLKSIPPAEQWINGELSINQIENIKIEDLLEREQIELNNCLIHEHLSGKRIFISGAAGSIGSEIVRQLLNYKPKQLILIDQAESALYDLETDLKRLSSSVLEQETELSIEVCNVNDETLIHQIFKKYKPEIIFHAAAYKHVPLMEKNPYNAFKVNVLGTKMMADLAHQYRVEKFLFVSTDKAVNPTNVMGATKRLAEVYVQSLNAQEGNITQFIVTRFGNVLGSNGSVIPLFKKQIEQGGPVTVTHPEIIRYFMTIPEACQLVLEAVSMGKGGEIFVFDMGKPVKIANLAKKMIRLSGFEPDVDIKIEFTGLRQGEKLFEELLGSGENELPTHHNKIKIAKLQAYDYNRLKGDLEAFVTEIHSKSHMDIVSFLKQEIPEYVSNNSIYELLDNSEIPS